MWGPSLALLSRSLRVDARLLRTHLFRAAFLGIIFLAMFFAHATSMMRGSPGLMFFSTITWLNFVFITLAGLSYFATAITEEKDEQMLGLLRMAGIGPLSLLLGKSTSRLMSSMLILSVQFPFTLLAVTLGGVMPRQIIAVYVALLAYMIFVANLGLLCSVYARGSGRAAAMMTSLMTLLLAILPLIAKALQQVVSLGGNAGSNRVVQAFLPAVLWLYDHSIINRLIIILSTGFNEPVFSQQVAVSLLGATALFGISWLFFDRFTEESAANGSWREWFTSRNARGGQRKPRAVWNNPFIWKDFHFTTGGWNWFLAKLITYGGIAGLVAYLNFGGGRFGVNSLRDFSQALIIVSIFLFAIELSIYASVLFREEVRLHTLPTLMLLPTSMSRIAFAKVLSLFPALVPATFLFLVSCVSHPEGAWGVIGEGLLSPVFWYMGTLFVLFLHVTVLMSLLVKWGALPLSLAIAYFFQSCFVGPIMSIFMVIGMVSGTEGLIIIPSILICFGICYALQVFIIRRLEALAAQ